MAETLLHGDCLELMRDIPDGSIDMAFMDLPYGVTCNRWDSVIPFEPLWEQLLRIGKRNAAFVFTATQPFATSLINSQPKLFRYDLVWQKLVPTGHLNAKRMPMRQHENVMVFYRELPVYVPQMEEGGRKGSNPGGSTKTSNYGKFDRNVTVGIGLTYPRSVFSVHEDAGRRTGAERTKHPTQKPVALLEWLIRTYTNPGDTVLDPTAGSFTTGVACVQTDRDFIGIEQDAGYFDIGKRRIAEARAKAFSS